MKSSKLQNTSHEEDDEFDDDFSSKKDPTSNIKDVKNNDRVSAIRSKHSVTEQRRRSKINERFQLLRDLIPHGDQKRDTASFLLEVIKYVQNLQEKVQNYEGSYQGLGTDSTKLMPWKHSQWRVPSYLGHPQSIKNGPNSGSASTCVGDLDERSFNSNPNLLSNSLNSVEIDSGHDVFRDLDQRQGLVETEVPMPTSFHMPTPSISQNDGGDSFATHFDDHPGEHVIEGGTISISSAYSHGLLLTLTQALQSSGVDLTEASISLRIDLGKRANQSLLPGISNSKERENYDYQDLKIGHGISTEESGQPHKKLKS